jgi:hypothetical protein
LLGSQAMTLRAARRDRPGTVGGSPSHAGLRSASAADDGQVDGAGAGGISEAMVVSARRWWSLDRVAWYPAILMLHYYKDSL